MDRLILDFEKNELTIETDSQQGVEIYPNLREKREEIYKILGYETVDTSLLAEAIEGLLNGRSAEEVGEKIDSWLKE